MKSLYLILIYLECRLGVAFYINNSLKDIIKSKYTKSTYDFEALWIEIEFTNQLNITCGLMGLGMVVAIWVIFRITLT